MPFSILKMWNLAPATSPFGGERDRLRRGSCVASFTFANAARSEARVSVPLPAAQAFDRRLRVHLRRARSSERRTGSCRPGTACGRRRRSRRRPGSSSRPGRRTRRSCRWTLNFDASKVPSVPNTTAVLPCAFSCCAKSCASEASWKGRKTTFVELVTLATSEEKSVAFWLTDSRSTLTPAFFRSRLDDAGEPGRVRLLVVDDHHARALA